MKVGSGSCFKTNYNIEQVSRILVSGFNSSNRKKRASMFVQLALFFISKIIRNFISKKQIYFFLFDFPNKPIAAATPMSMPNQAAILNIFTSI